VIAILNSDGDRARNRRLLSGKCAATCIVRAGKIPASSRVHKYNWNLPAIALLAIALFLLLLPQRGLAQKKKAAASPSAEGADPRSVTPAVSLVPRFSVGQSFRYDMEFETSTSTTRSGFAIDPQGPNQVSIIWNAKLRMEVLPAETANPGGTRLRLTYEKSAANVGSDTFDPSANATEQQYQKLEGKVIEFTLDANGKVQSISGLQGIVEDDKAVQAAMQWIAQLNAGSGAPAGGVHIGDRWSTEQPATSLLLPGLVWHYDSQYLRNEACHPPNADGPQASTAGGPPGGAVGDEMCAVILTHLSLVRLKPATRSGKDKNESFTEGTWTGSGEGLTYVSLRNGLAVSITQGATENLDVTITSARNSNMRYAGEIVTRSQVALQDGDAAPKK
jgi:hypothetical protein